MEPIIKEDSNQSLREDVLQYAANHYGTTPEYLWPKSPCDAVLRHQDNRKWYALLMNLLPEKLGLSGSEPIDILNIKCEPAMIGSLLSQKGYLPAYHMNKGNWVTILLDGSVEKDVIFSLLELSFDLTAGRRRKP